MHDKRMYSRVITLHEFCVMFLKVPPQSDVEMLQMFIEYKNGKKKIGDDIEIKGRAKGGSFFATAEAEFKKINKEDVDPKWVKRNPAVLKWSEASVAGAVLGVEIPQCNHLVVLHFLAFDNEVQKPIEEDARGNRNWIAGGRTKNLITGTADEGVEEVVIKSLPAKNRIKEVDYIGHVDYNL